MSNVYKYINLKTNAPEYPEGFQTVKKYDFYHEAADPITIYRDKGNSIAREFSEDQWEINAYAVQISTPQTSKYQAYVQQTDSKDNFLINLDQALDLFSF